MGSASHQTVKLSRGKHHSSDEGACAMELASMLAGEPFSDQPESVCPVIASFMRAYNDSIDDRRRRDLYEYASKAVGSRSSDEVQQARFEHLTAWGLSLHQRRWMRLLPRRVRLLAWTPELDLIGPQVVRAIATHDDRSHARALALIDQLLTIGRTERAADPERQDCVQRWSSTLTVTSATTEPSTAPASTSPG
jgi:hypothetical protein